MTHGKAAMSVASTWRGDPMASLIDQIVELLQLGRLLPYENPPHLDPRNAKLAGAVHRPSTTVLYGSL